MKTVISASRRTDVPAFYLKWFINSIREGTLEVSNPFYPAQKKAVSLAPEQVGWIVFWSRNYAAFLKNYNFFEAYNLFFHFTILSPSKLESVSIPQNKALGQIENLCKIYGPERIIWRYDPIVSWYESDILKTNFQEKNFEELCRQMHQLKITRCYTSFAFPYKKFTNRFSRKFPQDHIHQPELEEQVAVLTQMRDIASFFNISIYSCCNDNLLRLNGIHKGHCIDGQLLNELEPNIKISQAKHSTRKECGCTKSIDIGDYRQQPCTFGCIYCYANPVIK